MTSSSLVDGGTFSSADRSEFAGVHVFDGSGESLMASIPNSGPHSSATSSPVEDDGSDTYGALNPITCAFLDEKMEQEFLVQNKPRLITALRFGGGALFLIHLVLTATDVWIYDMFVWPVRYRAHVVYFTYKVLIFFYWHDGTNQGDALYH